MTTKQKAGGVAAFVGAVLLGVVVTYKIWFEGEEYKSPKTPSPRAGTEETSTRPGVHTDDGPTFSTSTSPDVADKGKFEADDFNPFFGSQAGSGGAKSSGDSTFSTFTFPEGADDFF